MHSGVAIVLSSSLRHRWTRQEVLSGRLVRRQGSRIRQPSPIQKLVAGNVLAIASPLDIGTAQERGQMYACSALWWAAAAGLHGDVPRQRWPPSG